MEATVGFKKFFLFLRFKIETLVNLIHSIPAKKKKKMNPISCQSMFFCFVFFPDVCPNEYWGGGPFVQLGHAPRRCNTLLRPLNITDSRSVDPKVAPWQVVHPLTAIQNSRAFIDFLDDVVWSWTITSCLQFAVRGYLAIAEALCLYDFVPCIFFLIQQWSRTIGLLLQKWSIFEVDIIYCPVKSRIFLKL